MSLMSSTSAAVLLEDVSFSFTGSRPMLFNLNVQSGETVAIMGPSGSGKTTLLNLIAGFEQPQSGRILIEGKDVTHLSPSQRPLSMVFQENNLFAHLTVEENIGLGRSPSLQLKQVDHAAIAEALSQTGLAGKGKRLPQALSGGERQRVALARVLVRQRPLLLLDESFASLGPALRDEMLDLVSEFQRLQKMTVLMVTHDPRDAARISEKLVFVENGAVEAVGRTDDFLSGNAPRAFRQYLGEQPDYR